MRILKLKGIDTLVHCEKHEPIDNPRIKNVIEVIQRDYDIDEVVSTVCASCKLLLDYLSDETEPTEKTRGED